MTLQSSTTSTAKCPAGGAQSSAGRQTAHPDRLGDILLEQLRYLVEYSDQERDRYERVKAILIESFR